MILFANICIKLDWLYLGEGELDAPHLTLVLEAVLANDSHLGIETVLLERALRLTEGFGIRTKCFGTTHFETL